MKRSNINVKKVSKKSQLSIFLIVAVSILLLIGAGFYVNTLINKGDPAHETEKEALSQDEAVKVKDFIDSCIEKTAFDGLKKLGKYGGYIETLPELDHKDTSFWYLDEVNVQPTLNETLKRLEKYIDDNLHACLDDFKYFKEQGFEVSYEDFTNNVFFSREDVNVEVYFPVSVKRKGKTKEYANFNAKLDVRYRQIFELATQIINRHMDAEFKFSSPLENVDMFGFDVINVNDKPTDTIIYSIVDNTRMVQGRNYEFMISARLKHSDLKRTIKLQENSNTVPTVLPFTLDSVDRLAQLNIIPGTTFNLDGAPVESISVQQFYPGNISREDVPFHEHADDSVDYDTLTWNLDYPVYEFEPTGMRFNEPRRLVLYWDEDRIPHKEEMGILYNDGEGWRPLPSKANYEENYIYTDIPGFSQYSVADCGSQDYKYISVQAEAGGEGGSCILTIVIVIVIVAMIVITMGGGASLAAGTQVGSGGAVAGSSGATYSVAGSTLQATAGATIPAGATITSGTAFASTSLLSAAGAASSGIMGTLSSATIGLVTASAFTGLGMAVVLVGGLVGGAYINSLDTFDVQKDSITFTPLCDQPITVTQDMENGEGKCMPKAGENDVTAGNPVQLAAQLESCTGWRKYLCGSCKLKCHAKYK